MVNNNPFAYVAVIRTNGYRIAQVLPKKTVTVVTPVTPVTL
jgi:hypothetical protein